MAAVARKRLAYVSDSESYSDSDQEYYPEAKYAKATPGAKTTTNGPSINQRDRQPTRVPTVFSRNAVMARENRMKKKQYVDNLERDLGRLRDQNKKLNSIMTNQSFVIAELKKEVKYVKNVLANSGDIGQILRAVKHNTGMSVKSSLGKNIWDMQENSYPSFPTPESDAIDEASINNMLPFSDSELLNLPLTDDFPLLDFEPNLDVAEAIEPRKMHLDEHNYTTTSESSLYDKGDKEDIGICLHISNHRVSLELCSRCNENATTNWSQNDD